MHLKIHEGRRKVIALCDSNLIGQKFEEGKMQIEIREHFFKGEEVDANAAAKILEEQAEDYATFNIVGEESVKVALECGVIDEGNVGKVGKVRFALLLS